MSILFFNIPASGHINPSLPVVQELVKRGETVLYYNTQDQRALIESSGATFVAYPNVDDFAQLNQAVAESNMAHNALLLLQIMERLLPFVLAEIDKHQPKLVIFDSLASWGNLATKIKAVRNMGFVTTFVMVPSAMGMMGIGTIAKLVGQLAQVFPQYWGIRQRYFRQYHAKQMVGLPDALMSFGDQNIVFTSAMFHPVSHAIPANFAFVGASILPRPHSDNFPFEQLTGKPLVYISMGTINNRQSEFYQMCFEAFAQHDGQFLMSVGKATDIASLGRIPANFMVKNFVPQLEILQKAHAFITHGGMNSVHEGFYYGVPMVVFPQQPEQTLIAKQVQQHQAGVMLTTPSVDGLRQALATILDNRIYQHNAARLGDSLREAGGYQRAAEMVLAYANAPHA
jgi:MGT family glycosyltransferase